MLLSMFLLLFNYNTVNLYLDLFACNTILYLLLSTQVRQMFLILYIHFPYYFKWYTSHAFNLFK